MAGAHATYAPSAAHRWRRCTGSIFLNRGKTSKVSVYAAKGTAQHEVAAMALRAGNDAAAYIGRVIHADGFEFTIDEEMAAAVQTYITTVRTYVDWSKGELLVEQSLPLEQLTAEEGASGTGDTVILAPKELIVIDAKFGQEQVDAEENDQLDMYGLSALSNYEMLGDFEIVRMVICQPYIDHVSEWVLPVADLKQRAGGIMIAVLDAKEACRIGEAGGDIAAFLNPGEKQCRWCQSKATCPALRAEVGAIVSGRTIATLDDFKNLDEKVVAPIKNAEPEVIGRLLPKLALIKMFMDAVQTRGDELALSGVEVPDHKLVTGKQGNRAWTDAAEAEAKLKGMRLKHEEMFSYSLISPTGAEKLLAKAKPKAWAGLQPLIARAPGKPTLVHVSDKRPPITIAPVADQFTDLTKTEAAADLV